MKPDANEKNDETNSQNELEKLLEQKQRETEALKRLIGVLENWSSTSSESDPKKE